MGIYKNNNGTLTSLVNAGGGSWTLLDSYNSNIAYSGLKNTPDFSISLLQNKELKIVGYFTDNSTDGYLFLFDLHFSKEAVEGLIEAFNNETDVLVWKGLGVSADSNDRPYITIKNDIGDNEWYVSFRANSEVDNVKYSVYVR